jgi:pimeloyl-ACP methyl ester carboxylesterase
MRARPLVAALAACGAAVAAAPATASAAVEFAPCEPAGYECGALAVPLDRSGARAGTVTLQAKRVRAAGNLGATAVVALAGGPGQAALPLAPDFADVMAPALVNRDLLVFDQRGTGRSGRLRCAALESSSASRVSAMRRCARQIGPQRAFYRTADSVADLEDLRREAGYEKLVLLGVSYGTKLALDYAAAYPDRVESLVLDSIVPPEGWDPLLRPTFAAVPRVLRGLCDGGACRGTTSDPVRDLRVLVRRVDRRSVSGPLPNARGRNVRVRITPLALFDLLIAGDENPTLRADLPAAVRSALAGDLRPLVRLRARAAGVNGIASRHLQRPGSDVTSDALYAATLCEESRFPWDRAAGAERRARSAVAAAQRLGRAALGPFTSEVALLGGAVGTCLGWPNAAPGPAAPGALPTVPTLLLDGTDDLRTPLESAQSVGARIPGAQVVEVPFAGHSTLGSDPGTCARDAVTAFVNGQPRAPCGTQRLLAPSPVAPTRLGRVPGRTRTARTLEALRATVRDVARQFTSDAIAAGRPPSSGSRVAGLRSGIATWRASGVHFSSVQYVPGVVVSGFLPHAEGAAATFTIAGSTAARGRVTIAPGGRVTGRLGGRRVSTTFASRASAAGSAAARATTTRDAAAREPRGLAQPRRELREVGALVRRSRLARTG